MSSLLAGNSTDSKKSASLPEHTYVRFLTINDVDKVVRLETAGFPVEERASKEKIQYRLTVCPELCLGLFVRKFEDEIKSDAVNETKADEEELIAHIIATKATTENVSDASMEIPELDSSGRIASPTTDPRGHREEGRTIAIHSVVVDPKYQGKSIGTILLKEYIQRLSTVKNADRFSIIAHDHLIPFYGRVGFESKGLSACNFSGGGWYDLHAPLLTDN